VKPSPTKQGEDYHRKETRFSWAN